MGRELSLDELPPPPQGGQELSLRDLPPPPAQERPFDLGGSVMRGLKGSLTGSAVRAAGRALGLTKADEPAAPEAAGQFTVEGVKDMAHQVADYAKRYPRELGTEIAVSTLADAPLLMALGSGTMGAGDLPALGAKLTAFLKRGKEIEAAAQAGKGAAEAGGRVLEGELLPREAASAAKAIPGPTAATRTVEDLPMTARSTRTRERVAALLNTGKRSAQAAGVGAGYGAAQSALSNYADTGKVSASQAGLESALGGLTGGAATLTGLGLRGLARGVTPRSLEYGDAVAQAEEMGFRLTPPQKSGKPSSAANWQLIKGVSPTAKAAMNADIAYNADLMTAKVGALANIASDRLDGEILKQARQDVGTHIGNILKGNKLSIAGDHELGAEINNLMRNIPAEAAPTRDFVSRMRDLAGGAELSPDAYLKLRDDLFTASRESGSEFDRRWYRQARDTIDSAFDRRLAASSGPEAVQKLAQARKLYSVNQVLREVAQEKNGLVDGHLNPDVLAATLTRRNPTWRSKPDGDLSDLESLAALSERLGIRPPNTGVRINPEAETGDRATRAGLTQVVSSLASQGGFVPAVAASAYLGGAPAAAASALGLTALPMLAYKGQDIARALTRVPLRTEIASPLTSAAAAQTLDANLRQGRMK